MRDIVFKYRCLPDVTVICAGARVRCDLIGLKVSEPKASVPWLAYSQQGTVYRELDLCRQLCLLSVERIFTFRIMRCDRGFVDLSGEAGENRLSDLASRLQPQEAKASLWIHSCVRGMAASPGGRRDTRSGDLRSGISPESHNCPETCDVGE